MRYYRTTGLTLTQMQELVRRINEALDEPWNKRTGRPKSLRLYKAVEAACMYLRQNATQEFIGETRTALKFPDLWGVVSVFLRAGHGLAAC